MNYVGRFDRFICPCCRGGQFGSSLQDGEIVARHCHTTPCQFSWPESDDWKYFHNVIMHSYSSKADYDENKEKPPPVTSGTELA